MSGAGPSQGRPRERGEAKARRARPQARGKADAKISHLAIPCKEAASNCTPSGGSAAQRRQPQAWGS
jgi:hypothetical protein